MVNPAATGGTTIASKRIPNRREVWKALHGPQDPRLKELSAMTLSRQELLMKLG
jgi:hypothetical protein